MKKSKTPLSNSAKDEVFAKLLQALPEAADNSEQATKLWQQLTRKTATSNVGNVTRRQHEGTWWPLQPGIAIKILHQNAAHNSRTFLMRLEPGACYKSHFHSHDEECFVLEGSVAIGDLRIACGDYHLAVAGSHHDLLHSDTGALLLLRAGFQETEPTWQEKLGMLKRRLFRSSVR